MIGRSSREERAGPSDETVEVDDDGDDASAADAETLRTRPRETPFRGATIVALEDEREDFGAARTGSALTRGAARPGRGADVLVFIGNENVGGSRMVAVVALETRPEATIEVPPSILLIDAPRTGDTLSLLLLLPLRF